MDRQHPTNGVLAGRAAAEDRIKLHSRPAIVQPVLYVPVVVAWIKSHGAATR